MENEAERMRQRERGRQREGDRELERQSEGDRERERESKVCWVLCPNEVVGLVARCALLEKQS